MRKSNKITVLGGGLWGTVLAWHLARNGSRAVTLWEFFPELAAGLRRTRRHPRIPGLRLAPHVEVTSDLERAAEGSSVLLFVLPSSFVRPTARRLKGLKRALVVNASKGIEPGTLMTMGEVIASEMKPRALYTLSGPSFAREVAAGVPTRLVLAGPAGSAARRLARLFEGGPVRVEASLDRKGVELGGSLKNALAIGGGILDGLGAGANTKAALLTQGMAEMAALIERSGGRRATIYGPAGLGDLIATGTSPESRNRGFGELLGKGLSAGKARKRIPTVVEGVEAVASARALARRLKTKVPLVEAVWQTVHAGRPAAGVLKALGF